MYDPLVIAQIQRKFHLLSPEMDERRRRQWAAAEAKELGWGGVSLVAHATGLSRPTISAGMRELERPIAQRTVEGTRVRRPGGGRPTAAKSDPGLMAALESLLDPVTRGDPESPLRWTCKSTRRLAEELSRQNHGVGPRTVATLLHEAGYSLQANRKTREGVAHPDRNAQFEYINASVGRALARGQPAISVDTKKKELVGDFKNGGREWHPQGEPEEVRVHDFLDKTLGKAIPYGVYDMVNDQGWVSVGIDHDTAQFATHSIRRWWQEMGRERFPRATELLITADGGGSNGHRTRLWKVSLQALADDLGLMLSVSHFPPGTSKWNKIEHRLFSFITQNWRGKPLVSHQAIINLIAATTTKSGLIVKAVLDTNHYPLEIKVSDTELAALCLERHEFHGDWNYTIAPRIKKSRFQKL
ncbi:ISAzo13-like element ISSiac3 family transposase [Singulisphaera acidiphila]|nr:ISAzo13-like element ISSiac3 family transposase [Singulisphaera acidiphila]